MGFLSGIFKFLNPISLLQQLLSPPKPPPYIIPKAEVPAPPAPVRRDDTGASIILGTDAVKNQRVSGSSRAKLLNAGSSDALGGLGRGSGLSI